jgi:hypothetical protein
MNQMNPEIVIINSNDVLKCIREGRGTVAQNKTCLFLGCGCAGVVALILAGLAAIALMGYGLAKDMARGMEDPGFAESKTLEMYQLSQLPEDLQANFFLSIPFLFDVSMISNADMSGGEIDLDLADFGILYVKIKVNNQDLDALHAFARNPDQGMPQMEFIHIGLENQTLVNHGTLTCAGQRFFYVRQHGPFVWDNHRSLGETILITSEAPSRYNEIILLFAKEKAVTAEPDAPTPLDSPTQAPSEVNAPPVPPSNRPPPPTKQPFADEATLSQLLTDLGFCPHGESTAEPVR